jgi:hypothetical protein
VRQQAAVSERLRAELERAAGDYNFALERKHQWPPMVRVLDTVTRVLPDDTWLTQLEVRTLPKGKERERELVMRGESANAGRLIPVLEESGLVAQVAPRSPTTKIQPGPGEVFDLGAQLKPLPKPALVPLVEAPSCRARSCSPRDGRARAGRDAREGGEAVTPAFLARLTPPQSRALALGLLAAAVAVALAILLAPVLMLHRHYDDAIETWTTRLATYRRVAAQAPALRAALDTMRTKDARRFYLRNTAANLAGAELQELVKSSIEQNGGRITTSQSPAPREDGGFRQIVANVQFFATTPNLQRILHTLETKEPLLLVDTLTIRPTNAFRGFKPAVGQEPEVNVQLDVSAWAMPEPAAKAAPGKAP